MKQSRPYKTALACLTLSLSTGALHAQGIAAVAVPQSGDNPAAIYHAKVRETITTVLQNWTESLEKKDSVATASAYAANARSLLGGVAEAVTPAAVVRQLYKTPLAGAQLAITVDDFDMSGEMAFVTCVLVAKTGPADSVPYLIRSVFVFRFDDWHNRWQVREQVIDWRGETEPGAPAQ
jgi:ketosteroid isomerase-like protein